MIAILKVQGLSGGLLPQLDHACFVNQYVLLQLEMEPRRRYRTKLLRQDLRLTFDAVNPEAILTSTDSLLVVINLDYWFSQVIYRFFQSRLQTVHVLKVGEALCVNQVPIIFGNWLWRTRLVSYVQPSVRRTIIRPI